MGIQDPYETQFIKQTKVLLDHTARDTMTNDLLRATTEQLRIEAGFPGSMEDIPWNILEPCLTECWMKQLATELSRHDMKIIDDCPRLRKNTENDKFIMQEAVRNGYRGRQHENRPN